jgi:short-subunit dehydrogenase involved in D-alanine esterification of teichoic acids
MKYAGLAGLSVLITGGTRGIGYAVANAFLEQEAEVHVTGTKKWKGDSWLHFPFCLETSHGQLS